MADEFTVAKAQFFGGGISVNKEETKLNVVTPQYNIPESRTRSETKSTTTVDTNVADTRLTTTVVTPGTLIITANNRSRNVNSPAYSFAGTEFTTQGLISGDTVTLPSISSTGATTSVGGSYPIAISGGIISAPGNYTNIIYREGIFTVAAEVANPISQSTTPGALGGTGSCGLMSIGGGGRNAGNVQGGTVVEEFTAAFDGELKSITVTQEDVGTFVYAVAVYNMGVDGPGGELGYVTVQPGGPFAVTGTFDPGVRLQKNRNYAIGVVGAPTVSGSPRPLESGGASLRGGRTFKKFGFNWVQTSPHLSVGATIRVCPTSSATAQPLSCFTGTDPVAESFKFGIDCFVTGVDVYFETVDPNGGDLFFQLRTMENGFPTTTILAEKFVAPIEITANSRAEVPHHVEFRHPTFIKAGEEYCLVVGGFSPNHRIWVARLGETLINNSSAVAENTPDKGVSFRSQNSSTWTVEGAETMKFSLWTAKFTSAEMNLQFNAKVVSELLPVDPFECETGVNKLRVVIPDHGLCEGDIINLSMFSENVYRLTLTAPAADARPVVGHLVSTGTASAIISSVTPVSLNVYDVTFTGQSGLFTNSSVFTCDSFEVHSAFGSDAFTEVISAFSGVMTQVPTGAINGVDLAELNKDVAVTLVDSIDTFLIDIVSTPSASGRFGGSGVTATPNFKYEIMNVSGEYESHGGAESWSFTGVNHVSDGGPFLNNYTVAAPKAINLKTDYHLDTPYKIANTLNESRRGVKSVTVNGTLQAASINVTPVVNIESFSLTAVSNHVGVEDQTLVDISPNAVGRFVAETDANLGSHAYKYVTKKITLAKAATEVKIMFDVYKDVNADFDVYIKTQEQYSSDSIDSYPWKLVPISSKPHSVNLEDRIEYDLNCSGVVAGWPSDLISFKVKIVGRTTNPAKPPLFKNLRIIALT